MQMPWSNCLFLSSKRTSADQGANIEVPENNEENDPIPKSTDITADHIETELHGTE